MNIVDIIAKKRDGDELSSAEIQFFVRGVVSGSVPDYQAAALLMATYLRGMNRRETLDLTLAMRDSGETIDLSGLPGTPAIDKHSTGGVGDKATLVVVPILAACGVPVLKMSGRGLGYSGGTVDKLESIPGFRTHLSIAEAKEIVSRVGAVLIGQSGELAPADKILYALRDVTATIECISLIAASIMSKKLAAGAKRIVLDVKCGKGAFMKTRARAEELAHELVRIGNGAGVPTTAVISAMDEPLGRTVGNALEVREAVQNLLPQGSMLDVGLTGPPDVRFRELSVELAAHGLHAAGVADTPEECVRLAAGSLASGEAYRALERIVAEQGGPSTLKQVIQSLPTAPTILDVASRTEGVVTELDAEKIGRLATEMGAGRLAKTDTIDPAVGIELLCKTGDTVAIGTTLARMHLSERCLNQSSAYAERLLAAYNVGTGDVALLAKRPLIYCDIS